MNRSRGFLWVLCITAVMALSAPGFAAELVHEVRDGESASSIAERYYGGFELTDLLLRYNGKTRAVLQPGENLRIPFSETHTVHAGDTWSEIAQRYLDQPGDYEVIARMNGLSSKRPLKVGDRILVPVFLSHSLTRGETLGVLAELYYGDSERGDLLRSYNRIDDPRRLSVGQQIRVPLLMPAVKPPPQSAKSTSRAKTKPVPTAVPVQPVAAEATPAARRFVEPLRTARREFHAGDYVEVLETLEPLIQSIEQDGSPADRTELWELLAFVYVAFDRTEEACAAYGLAGTDAERPSLNPDLVSPKIRDALADCQATGSLRAGR